VAEALSVTGKRPSVAGTTPPEGPSLDWLIHPTGKEAFFAENWERTTLVVHREQSDYFSGLLSLDEVDHVLTTLGRRYPEVILKDASRKLTAEDYTTNGATLDIARVCQLFGEGSTITLAYLDTVLPKLTRFCRSLESEFSCPCQTNIYLTPPGAQGARTHYDTHDVFVMQVAGSKDWTIFNTAVELPLSGQEFDAEAHPIGAPTLQFTLNAGDTAYVPRGALHEARSTNETSLHITAGVLRYTWADLLLEFVAGASLNDAVLRKALPPGFARSEFDRTAARETLRELLRRVADNGDFDAAFDHFVDDLLVSCPPSLRGQMAQVAGLDRVTIDSPVVAREAVIWRVETEGDFIVIRCANRRIKFPAHAGEAVRFALGRRRFTVRDLPSGLDDEGKLALVRRLVREGLLMVADD
jgi:hypothetical protein